MNKLEIGMKIAEEALEIPVVRKAAQAAAEAANRFMREAMPEVVSSGAKKVEVFIESSLQQNIARDGIDGDLNWAGHLLKPAETITERVKRITSEAESAKNSENPIQLKLLSQKEAEVVRYAVANNHKTDVETLETLAAAPEWHVRMAVASNPNTSDTIMRRLAVDSSPKIRSLIAKKDFSLPVDIAKTLATDESAMVRNALVSRRPYLSDNISKLMMDDIVPEIRVKAGERLKKIDLLAFDRDWKVQLEVARRTYYRDTLEHLSSIVNKRFGSDHPNAKEFREAFRQNPASRSELENDPGSPVAVLSRVRQTNDQAAIKQLANLNDNFVLAGLAANKSAPDFVLRHVAQFKVPQIDAELAMNPNTPREIVNAMVSSPDPIIRLHVAINSKSREVLEKLMSDPELDVSKKAAFYYRHFAY
ncbi:MAG: hypothetical protein P4L53_24420 [Candidatus Obscuribacterales bacterium]|nr:hypothetical protein [Candidatus Obscuribacterales bacterium]